MNLQLDLTGLLTGTATTASASSQAKDGDPSGSEFQGLIRKLLDKSGEEDSVQGWAGQQVGRKSSAKGQNSVESTTDANHLLKSTGMQQGLAEMSAAYMSIPTSALLQNTVAQPSESAAAPIQDGAAVSGESMPVGPISSQTPKSVVSAVRLRTDAPRAASMGQPGPQVGAQSSWRAMVSQLATSTAGGSASDTGRTLGLSDAYAPSTDNQPDGQLTLGLTPAAVSDSGVGPKPSAPVLLGEPTVTPSSPAPQAMGQGTATVASDQHTSPTSEPRVSEPITGTAQSVTAPTSEPTVSVPVSGVAQPVIASVDANEAPVITAASGTAVGEPQQGGALPSQVVIAPPTQPTAGPTTYAGNAESGMLEHAQTERPASHEHAVDSAPQAASNQLIEVAPSSTAYTTVDTMVPREPASRVGTDHRTQSAPASPALELTNESPMAAAMPVASATSPVTSSPAETKGVGSERVATGEDTDQSEPPITFTADMVRQVVAQVNAGVETRGSVVQAVPTPYAGETISDTSESPLSQPAAEAPSSSPVTAAVGMMESSPVVLSAASSLRGVQAYGKSAVAPMAGVEAASTVTVNAISAPKQDMPAQAGPALGTEPETNQRIADATPRLDTQTGISTEAGTVGQAVDLTMGDRSRVPDEVDAQPASMGIGTPDTALHVTTRANSGVEARETVTQPVSVPAAAEATAQVGEAPLAQSAPGASTSDRVTATAGTAGSTPVVPSAAASLRGAQAYGRTTVTSTVDTEPAMDPTVRATSMPRPDVMPTVGTTLTAKPETTATTTDAALRPDAQTGIRTEPETSMQVTNPTMREASPISDSAAGAPVTNGIQAPVSSSGIPTDPQAAVMDVAVSSGDRRPAYEPAVGPGVVAAAVRTSTAAVESPAPVEDAVASTRATVTFSPAPESTIYSSTTVAETSSTAGSTWVAAATTEAPSAGPASEADGTAAALTQDPRPRAVPGQPTVTPVTVSPEHPAQAAPSGAGEPISQIDPVGFGNQVLESITAAPVDQGSPAIPMSAQVGTDTTGIPAQTAQSRVSAGKPADTIVVRPGADKSSPETLVSHDDAMPIRQASSGNANGTRTDGPGNRPAATRSEPTAVISVAPRMVAERTPGSEQPGTPRIAQEMSTPMAGQVTAKTSTETVSGGAGKVADSPATTSEPTVNDQVVARTNTTVPSDGAGKAMADPPVTIDQSSTPAEVASVSTQTDWVPVVRTQVGVKAVDSVSPMVTGQPPAPTSDAPSIPVPGASAAPVDGPVATDQTLHVRSRTATQSPIGGQVSHNATMPQTETQVSASVPAAKPAPIAEDMVSGGPVGGQVSYNVTVPQPETQVSASVPVAKPAPIAEDTVSGTPVKSGTVVTVATTQGTMASGDGLHEVETRQSEQAPIATEIREQMESLDRGASAQTERPAIEANDPPASAPAPKQPVSTSATPEPAEAAPRPATQSMAAGTEVRAGDTVSAGASTPHPVVLTEAVEGIAPEIGQTAHPTADSAASANPSPRPVDAPIVTAVEPTDERAVSVGLTSAPASQLQSPPAASVSVARQPVGSPQPVTAPRAPDAQVVAVEPRMIVGEATTPGMKMTHRAESIVDGPGPVVEPSERQSVMVAAQGTEHSGVLAASDGHAVGTTTADHQPVDQSSVSQEPSPAPAPIPDAAGTLIGVPEKAQAGSASEWPGIESATSNAQTVPPPGEKARTVEVSTPIAETESSETVVPVGHPTTMAAAVSAVPAKDMGAVRTETTAPASGASAVLREPTDVADAEPAPTTDVMVPAAPATSQNAPSADATPATMEDRPSDAQASTLPIHDSQSAPANLPIHDSQSAPAALLIHDSQSAPAALLINDSQSAPAAPLIHDSQSAPATGDAIRPAPVRASIPTAPEAAGTIPSHPAVAVTEQMPAMPSETASANGRRPGLEGTGEGVISSRQDLAQATDIPAMPAETGIANGRHPGIEEVGEGVISSRQDPPQAAGIPVPIAESGAPGPAGDSSQAIPVQPAQSLAQEVAVPQAQGGGETVSQAVDAPVSVRQPGADVAISAQPAAKTMDNRAETPVQAPAPGIQDSADTRRSAIVDSRIPVGTTQIPDVRVDVRDEQIRPAEQLPSGIDEQVVAADVQTAAQTSRPPNAVVSAKEPDAPSPAPGSAGAGISVKQADAISDRIPVPESPVRETRLDRPAEQASSVRTVERAVSEISIGAGMRMAASAAAVTSAVASRVGSVSRQTDAPKTASTGDRRSRTPGAARTTGVAAGVGKTSAEPTIGRPVPASAAVSPGVMETAIDPKSPGFVQGPAGQSSSAGDNGSVSVNGPATAQSVAVNTDKPSAGHTVVNGHTASWSRFWDDILTNGDVLPSQGETAQAGEQPTGSSASKAVPDAQTFSISGEASRRPEREPGSRDSVASVPGPEIAHINVEPASGRQDRPTVSATDAPVRRAIDPSLATSMIHQIVKGAKVAIVDGGGTMTMQLEPAHLGSVRMDVTVQQGVVTATIEAGTDTAKRVLESDLAGLKRSLSDAGMVVDSVKVSVSSDGAHGFGMQSNLNHGRQEQTFQRSPQYGHVTRDQEIPQAVAQSAAPTIPAGQLNFLV